MQSDKVLLLSDGSVSIDIIDPNEILLRFLSMNFSKKSLIRVILSRKISNERTAENWYGFNFILLKRIKDSWRYLFKFLSFIPDSLSYIYLVCFIIPKQRKEIKKLIKEESITKIWIVMTSPHVIFLSRKLIKHLNIRIFTTVWDSPEEFSLLLHMPWVLRQKMLLDFETIMKQSSKIGVASTNMKKEYELRFKRKCFMLQGDVVEDSLISSERLLSSKYIIIGFAGWLYTPDVWDALFKALDLIGWEICDKVVKIRIIGNAISFTPPGKCFIEYLGKLQIERVREILSDSFINFVPYKFSETSKYGSSVSFPSKINTYLAAKRPILTIAPAYSTPFQFVKENEIGEACNSLLPEDILGSIKKLILDENQYQKYMTNTEKIYTESFSPIAFNKAFREFIDLPQVKMSV